MNPVYVASERHLLKLQNNGTMDAKVVLGHSTASSPALSSDRVFVSGTSGLHAFTFDLVQHLVDGAAGHGSSSPAIGPEGNLYVVTSNWIQAYRKGAMSRTARWPSWAAATRCSIPGRGITLTRGSLFVSEELISGTAEQDLPYGERMAPSIHGMSRAAPIRIPSAVWVLGGVSLLMDVSSEMIHSLLPLFMVTTLGLGAFTVGVIEGLAESTALIVKVFSGVLSDYLGKRKWLAVFGYALGALTKPLFAVAPTAAVVLTARLLDRVGKGVRGAPRDALVADITPPELRGAAFGLRQSLDTVGAFIGPLLATGLMLLWADDFRAVFWVAVIPGAMAVALLQLGVREPERQQAERRTNPIRRENLKRLGAAYWWVVGVGAVFTLARFSEAFLVLRARQGGVPLALVPLVMVAMNVIYSLSAYPFGKLSDRVSHTRLLALGLVVLVAADLVLAVEGRGVVLAGVALWGVHMGMTQGLLATMVADTAPADLRGTAYGFFNLTSGVAMLVASALAGLLWERLGASSTFHAGAAFCVIALIGLVWRPTARSVRA